MQLPVVLRQIAPIIVGKCFVMLFPRTLSPLFPTAAEIKTRQKHRTRMQLQCMQRSVQNRTLESVVAGA